MIISKSIFFYGMLLSSLLLFNGSWFYDGRVIFDRQVIIEVQSEYDIPFELNHENGGRIKININSSEEIRFTLLDDENYLKKRDGESYIFIVTEDDITKFNITYEIPYKGSFYIFLYNHFILNDDAIVDIKLEVFEINLVLILITVVFTILFIIIITSTIISIFLIYKKRKIQNKNIEIINLIIEKLLSIDDESDIIDFKMYLPNKEKVIKIISAFCHGYLLNRKESYIVFGVKDKKLLQNNFTIIDRLIPLEKVLENSLINTKYPRTIEGFKICLIDILESEFDPVPDTCFNIKTLNLNGYGGITVDSNLIIIEFNKFNLSQLIPLKDGRIFIRSEGRNRRAQDSDIEELKLKLT